MNLNLIPQETLDSLSEQLGQIRRLLENLKPQNDNGVFLTNKEAASYLKVTSRTLQKYRDSGLVEFSQIGRKIFYRKEHLEEFVLSKSRIGILNIKGGIYEN